VSEQTTNRSFDELARGLASGEFSRRKALRLMGAALLGGTLGSLGIGGIAAADDLCKPEGKKCRKDEQCCSGKCEGSECAAVVCSPAGSCPNIPLGCEGDINCGCLQTVEGIGFCASNWPCEEAQTCTTTADCPAGYACTAVSCCPDVVVCAPPCAGTSGLTAARTAGPTILGG
jgi:hypothetical protein